MMMEAVGGSLIGLAAAVLWLGVGRIAGITGVVANIFLIQQGHRNWSLYFLAGLLLSFLLYSTFSDIEIEITSNVYLLAIGGLLVGSGTYIANGCTSGHGVCGSARFSLRSVFATLIFMLAGMVTVFVMKLFALS